MLAHRNALPPALSPEASGRSEDWNSTTGARSLLPPFTYEALPRPQVCRSVRGHECRRRPPRPWLGSRRPSRRRRKRQTECVHLGFRRRFLHWFQPGRRPGDSPFLEQKPAKRTEIVEDPPALVQMQLQPLQVIRGQSQGIQAARSVRGQLALKVGFNFSLGVGDGIGEQADEIVRALDAVKRTSRCMGHRRPLFCG